MRVRRVTTVASACALIFIMVIGGANLGGMFPVSGRQSTLHSTNGADASGSSAIPTISHASTISKQVLALHDLKVTASNVTTLAGDPVEFTITPPNGVTISSYTWWWGDGSTSATSSTSTAHTYSSAGIYLIYAEGTDSLGSAHDNLGSLLPLAVLNGYTNDSLGNLVQIAGSVVANTTSDSNAIAVISPGGSLTLSNWITGNVTSPYWVLGQIGYVLSSNAGAYASLSKLATSEGGLNGVTVGFSPSTPTGSYDLTFSVVTQSRTGTPPSVRWSNFTYTMFVGVGAGALSPTPPVSNHPGIINDYTNAGPPVTSDPIIEYNVLDAQVDYNIYQTLITYNGTTAGPDPSDFVPDLATCVPGGNQCVSMYGSDLISGDNVTFVINPDARFYNASTQTSWAVRPNDVAFSIARDCALSESAGYQSTAGWILCQTLVPGQGSPHNASNAGWDGGYHAPMNTTPSNILAAITVNSSLYCTASMKNGIQGAGCVTFSTYLSNENWPDLLQFFETPDGTSIMSCTWSAKAGLGLPGWNSSAGICYGSPPGSPGNPNPVPSPTAWDGYEHASAATFVSPAQFGSAGSGPYALSFENKTIAKLMANPSWGGTTCVGGIVDGCLPPAAQGGTVTYMPEVNLYFESTTAPGMAAARQGEADLLSVDTNNYSYLVREVQSGALDVAISPSITTANVGLNLNFSVSGSQSFDPQVNVPSNILQDLNLRQFLIHAYPAGNVIGSDCIVDGFQTCFQSGGAIPALLGNYYPKNISWNFGTPDTNPKDVGGAAWWWVQTASDSLAGHACTSISPCTLLIPNGNGAPFGSVLQAWSNEVYDLSGGAIVLTPVSMTWFEMYIDSFYQGPGNSFFPISQEDWAPDYFGPSDYVGPFYGDTGVYSLNGGDYPPSFSQPQLDNACAGTISNPTVTQNCQGFAYSEMNNLFNQANGCVAPCSGAQRALLYDMGENIAEELGLSQNLFQATSITPYAPWIESSSFDTNPVNVGVIQAFYDLSYVQSIPPGHPLNASSPTGGGGMLPAGSRTAKTLETGEPLVLLVGVAGGSGNYTYKWNGLPAGCASQDSPVLRCIPTQVGNFSVDTLVTDSLGNAVTTSPISVQLTLGSTITRFSASPSSLTLGTSTNLTVKERGGTAPMNITYSGLPPGCSSQNVSKLYCKPTSTGNYTIIVTVTDALGVSVSNSTVLKVVPLVVITLSSADIAPVNPTLTEGSTRYLNVTAWGSNGLILTTGVTEAWTLSPATLGNLSTATGSSVQFSAGKVPETGVVLVNVSYQGVTLRESDIVTVSPIQGTPLSVGAITVSPATPVVGGNLSLVLAVKGGVAPLTFAWSGLPTGCATANSSTLSCTPASAGSYGVQVLAVDAVGGRGTSSAWVNVTAATVNTLSSVKVTPVSSIVLIGKTLSFTATPTCVSSPCPPDVEYSWTLSNSTLGSLSTTNQSSTTFTAGSQTGAVALTLTASLNGVSKTASATVTISTVVVPTLISVTMSISSTAVAAGGTQPVSVTPACSPGSCPSSGITYTWSLSNSLGSISPAGGQSTTFTAGSQAGTVTLSVHASLNGTTVEDSAAITITSTGTTSTSSSTTLEDALLLSMPTLAIVAAMAIVFFLGKKKGGEPTHLPTSSAGTEEPSKEGPSKPTD